jgi:predicted nucleic acid-binding Zn ribbon protein
VSTRDPHDAAVPRIDEPLGAIRREFGLGDPGAIDVLRAGWDDLVGPALAAHSHPRAIRSGVLSIVVDEPAWAGQLRYLDEVLIARIAESLPGIEVHEVRVSVAARPTDRG